MVLCLTCELTLESLMTQFHSEDIFVIYFSFYTFNNEAY